MYLLSTSSAPESIFPPDPESVNITQVSTLKSAPLKFRDGSKLVPFTTVSVEDASTLYA